MYPRLAELPWDVQRCSCHRGRRPARTPPQRTLALAAGPGSGDERLRRRQTGDDSDYWDAAEPAVGGSSGGGALSGSGPCPGGSAFLPENPASPPGELPLHSLRFTQPAPC